MARPSFIRSRWAQRAIDSAQLLVGAIEQRDVASIENALQHFERMTDGARTVAERLMLRGLLVDLYLVTEQKLEPLLTVAAERARGASHR